MSLYDRLQDPRQPAVSTASSAAAGRRRRRRCRPACGRCARPRRRAAGPADSSSPAPPRWRPWPRCSRSPSPPARPALPPSPRPRPWPPARPPLPLPPATPPTRRSRARRSPACPTRTWTARFGWRAAGQRTDSLDGRATRTVFYRHTHHRIGYTVISGKPLKRPAGAQRLVVNGVEMYRYRDGRNTVVVVRAQRPHVRAGRIRALRQHAAEARLLGRRRRGPVLTLAHKARPHHTRWVPRI